MSETPGPHAQNWCRSRFTYRMCAGYVFEGLMTLRRRAGLADDAELAALPAQVELLCSWSHHDRLAMLGDDQERFGRPKTSDSSPLSTSTY